VGSWEICAVKTEKRSKNYLTPQEAADLLMVSPVTVRQWAHKGLLDSSSTPGGHRRFARDEIERFAREHGTVLRSPMHNGLRVLIVDDDEQTVTYLTEVLSGTPEHVLVQAAHDGFDAGRMVQSFSPHVILLDLKMPGLDGVEVCRRLKGDMATRAIRIIGMTGYPSEENLSSFEEAGVEVCLKKPFDRAHLVEAIGFERPKQYG
jgi:excisionase family DNA binding protein